MTNPIKHFIVFLESVVLYRFQQTDILLVFFTDDSEKASIKEAMDTFHKKTCVRFVPHRGQSDYLSIESEMGYVEVIGQCDEFTCLPGYKPAVSPSFTVP